MKILLVQPPVHDPTLAFAYATEPLGLETIAATVPEHEVHLVDLRFEDEPLADTLERLRPDVVGTGGDTVNTYDMIEILRTARRHLPGVHTVVGGTHASLRPQDFADPAVDAAVLGPGEHSFPELLAAWERGGDLADVPGLALLHDGQAHPTAERPFPRNLDHSPPPLRSLTARYRKRYKAFGRPLALVNTSRGCPYDCTFCSIGTEYGGRYLTKHPDRVIEDLARVEQRAVRFADGNTFGSPRRAEQLAAAITGAGLDKRFMVDARADTAVRSPGLFETWRRAGLEIVAMGLEAVTEERLQALGKRSSLHDNIEAIRILRGSGLKVIGQFIVDPDFDERDFDELQEFVCRHDVHYPSFTIATPFPGTVMYEQRAHRVVSRDWRRYDVWHAITVPRLGWEGFYRRFIDLYQTCYGPARVWEALRQRALHSHTGASPLLLAAVATQVRLSRRVLSRAYGLR